MMYLGDKAVGIATKKELNGFFKVVHRFIPDEDIVHYTFPNYGSGFYVFAEDPILTHERYIAENYSGHGLVAGGGTVYSTDGKTFNCRACVTATITSTYSDYWVSYFTCDNDTITIGISSSNSTLKFLTGHEYVIMKSID